MKLKEYLEQENIALQQASQELGVPYETMRRWCVEKNVPPKDNMIKIVTWSGGKVQPNDFYDLGE